MRAFAPACLLAALALAACTPASAPAPAGKAAAPAPRPAPAAAAPASPAAAPADLEALALSRDLEIERLQRAVAPYRRGGAFGLVYVDGVRPAAAPPEAGPAWDKLAERLRGRFGALRPLTPLAADLAADSADEPAALLLRRAAAAQGLDYLIVYRLRVEPGAPKGLFGGGAPTRAAAEAAILDVRRGAILGGVETATADADDVAQARTRALLALGDELENLGRRLDAEAMRAAGPPS